MLAGGLKSELPRCTAECASVFRLALEQVAPDYVAAPKSGPYPPHQAAPAAGQGVP